MKTLHLLFALVLIAVLFTLPFAVNGQEEGVSPELAAALPIPAVLLGLMALNNRVTEAVKLYLAADKLPFTPSEDIRRFLVLLSSMVVGIVSAAVTPDALTWLGEGFNPYAAIVITGVAASLGGGFAQLVLSVLASLRREPVVASKETTVTIDAPVTDPATAKAILNVLKDEKAVG